MDGFPPQGLGQVLRDIGAVTFYFHSRWRVYPQDVTVTPLLTADAAADTFGAWVQIVPINIVPFPFHVVGLVVEQVSAVGTYHIQVGCSPTAAAPGLNHEAGERRVRMATVPVARATELLEIRGRLVSANHSVWARVKTASLVADTCNLSIVLSRHVEGSYEYPRWPAFPW